MPEEVLVRPAVGARIELAAMVIGGIAGLTILHALLGGQQTDFENLGLGTETRAYYAREGDRRIHCMGRFEEAQECIEGALARRGDVEFALWLGNSQLHGINQMSDGEETATAIAHRHLAPKGVDLIAVSRGNTNPEDHLVWFSYLQTRLSLRALVLPVVFVSLRRSGVHSTMAPVLDDPASAALLAKSEIGRKILEEGIQWGEGDGDDALEGTPQEVSEALIVDWLEEHSGLWNLRAEARGNFFRFLRSLRNTALGIAPETKRPMLRGSYERNMDAVAAILDLAGERGVDVLVYVAPLRQDVASPYVAEEYAAFKRELADLTRRRGARFEDLDELVPNRFWGRTNSTRLGDEDPEIDFLHFQYPGHVLMGERVSEILQAGGLLDRR